MPSHTRSIRAGALTATSPRPQNHHLANFYSLPDFPSPRGLSVRPGRAWDPLPLFFPLRLSPRALVLLMAPTLRRRAWPGSLATQQVQAWRRLARRIVDATCPYLPCQRFRSRFALVSVASVQNAAGAAYPRCGSPRSGSGPTTPSVVLDEPICLKLLNPKLRQVPFFYLNCQNSPYLPTTFALLPRS